MTFSSPASQSSITEYLGILKKKINGQPQVSMPTANGPKMI
jgi:hypothetical protein